MDDFEQLKLENRNSDLSYAKFLKNKKIVLVGPSPDMINNNKGELIDSYDIVVRINKGFIIFKELEKDIGRRTDILYSSLNNKTPEFIEMVGDIRIENLLNKNIKWICSTNFKNYKKGQINEKKFIEQNRGRIPFHIMNNEYNLFIEENIKKRLFSGSYAIFDLISFDIKELFIIGLTFCKIVDKEKGIYYYQYKDPNFRPKEVHDIDSQLDYFNKIYKEDKRIKCNKVLEKILENLNGRQT